MSLAVIIESISQLELVNKLLDTVIYEFRVDRDRKLLDEIDKLIADNLQVILTLRSGSEGGGFEGTRDDLINEMLASKVKYVDLEFDRDTLPDNLNEYYPTVIISKHDYSASMSQTLNGFIEVSEQIQNRKDLVVKFVGNPIDCFDLLYSISRAKSVFPRSVILGIGKYGILSRTMATSLKQEFVFGALEDTIDIPNYAELLDAFQENALLTGLIGKTLDHSLSPLIHNILRREVELPGFYHLLEIHTEEKIEEFIELLKQTDLKGYNITFPYKTKLPKMTIQGKWVKILGVCNTIQTKEGKLYSFNTDVTGFMKFGLEIGLENYSKILIFGAGGASIAICYALLELGIDDITIVNRTKSRLDSFPNDLKKKIVFQTLTSVNNQSKLLTDVYINATTIGYDGKNPVDVLPLPMTTKLVIDLNYNPSNTVLVRYAKEQGIEAFDGKKMLFHQAVDAFEIWSGKSINRRSAYEKFRRELDE